jgi:hypothetical protein
MGRTAKAPRLDATLTDVSSVHRAQRLMNTLRTGNADLFRGALDVLDWCVREVRDGRLIGSIDPDKHVDGIREFSSPLLEAARHEHVDAPNAPRLLHGAAFDRVVQLIESPPEPTPALRQLMAEAYAR